MVQSRKYMFCLLSQGITRPDPHHMRAKCGMGLYGCMMLWNGCLGSKTGAQRVGNGVTGRGVGGELGAQFYLCLNVKCFLSLFCSSVLVLLYDILGTHRWGNRLLTSA